MEAWGAKSKNLRGHGACAVGWATNACDICAMYCTEGLVLYSLRGRAKSACCGQGLQFQAHSSRNDTRYSPFSMLNAPETRPWKCGGGQAGGGGAGSGGVIQVTTNTGAPRVGLWAELQSKESECILRLSTFHYKFQESAAQLPTINKESVRSGDQHVQPIRALTIFLYARNQPDSRVCFEF